MVTADQVFTPTYAFAYNESKSTFAADGYQTFPSVTLDGFVAPDQTTVIPTKSGVYLITYKVSVGDGYVSTSVVVNGSKVPGSKFQQLGGVIMGQAIATLPANGAVKLLLKPLGTVLILSSSITITQLK